MTGNAKAGNRGSKLRTARKDQRKSRTLSLLLLSTFLGSIGAGGYTNAMAQQASQTLSFNIPSQPLASALSAFMSASDWDVSFTSTAVAGKQSAAVVGKFSAEQALRTLLAGTGVSIRMAGSKTAALVVPAAGAGETGSADGTTLEPIVLTAQAGGTTEGSGSYTTPQMSSATGLPLSIKETPQAVSVVTRQAIDDKNYSSLDQAVKDSPGLSAVQDIADGRWRYTSRGFDVFNIQNDGLTMAPVRDGLPQDDLSIYDRVEIVRGATGLLEGAGYPSATINLVRKKALQEPRYSVTTTGSSWGNGRVELDASQPLNADGSVRGRFVAAFNGGEGYRDYNKQKNLVLYGTLEADITDDTTISVGLSHTKERIDGYSWAGVPTHGDGSFFNWDTSDFFGADWEYADKRKTTAYFDIQHEFEGGWKANLSAQRVWASSELLTSYLSDWSQIDVFTKNDRIYEYDADNYAVNAQLSGPVEFLGQTHDLTFGVSAHRDNQENSGYRGASYLIDPTTWDPSSIAKPSLDTYTKYYTTKYKQDEIGIYGAGRFHLTDDLTLIAGGRFSWFDYASPTVPSYYHENGKFVPYLGVVYDVTDQVSVYASYTSIFRAQNRIDPTGQLLPAIDGANYEAGVKGSFFDDRLNATVSVFQINLSNLPETVAASECQASSSCYRAGEEVRSRGIELEVSGHITDQWQLMAGYTYSKPEYVDGPNSGDRYNSQVYPEHMFKMFTTYSMDGALEGLTVGGGLRAFSNTFYDGGSYRIEQPAYAVADLMMKYDFNDKTALQLNVNNVFDKKYYGAISTYTGYGNHLGAPREFRLSLSHTF
ncbi:TonB-dependent siderophore receptor [Aliirhizobium smilacinae]|uniref:TonB-dependent siderophore receptor n=1 Tax=Aliirhizobium smilacinae TaxID=1395944 RepID=A0A5C4X849_9HYPH|nr:TonB-dependent receptor [Rhizobium smilacinae]TNM59518.1 TonB-dependent siderophore receptor [Rhizobium smilacinae]